MAEHEGERQRVFETLLGILEGIAVDREISPRELEGLSAWLDAHRNQGAERGQRYLYAAQFEEVERVVAGALHEGSFGEQDHARLLNFCRDFTAKHSATRGTTRSAFARLQGMALGVLADGRLDDAEIFDLREWLRRYEHLRHHFVFEAFFDMLDEVTAGGVIDKKARARLTQLCETFSAPPPVIEARAGFTPAPAPDEVLAAKPATAAAPAPAGPGRAWPRLPRPLAAMRFVCLDLETANHGPTSVCALGVATCDVNGKLAAGASLVNPGTSFDPRHVRMHGISAAKVQRAPSFARLWPQLAPLLSGAWVLAHNATFTARCLSALLNREGLSLDAPPKILCTLQLARKVWPRAPGYALGALASDFSLTPPAHDPVAGARACAELALRMCEQRGLDHPWRIAAEFGVKPVPLSLHAELPISS